MNRFECGAASYPSETQHRCQPEGPDILIVFIDILPAYCFLKKELEH